MKKYKFFILGIVFLVILGVFFLFIQKESYKKIKQDVPSRETIQKSNISGEKKFVTFAGGCFWCMESAFEELVDVGDVISGFSGGEEENSTYKQVSSGNTGHVEAIQFQYDSELISYKELLEIFWKQINPTDDGGQFVDRGFQYTSAIFYHDEEQKRLAEDSLKMLETSNRFGKPILTRIVPYTAFYPAEEYHQDYYKKNSIRYKFYRYNSGRDQYLKKIWGSEEELRVSNEKLGAEGDELSSKYKRPSDEEIRKKLTPLQFHITQEDGTERSFNNEYWDNKEKGVYVDVVSGEPLFSSTDKYKSGTGWPSFSKPINPKYIVEREDRSWFLLRTELRSKYGDSHLGHLFDDGPEPYGLRYCINSAALKFIPLDAMYKEGYEEYLDLFE